MFLLFHILIALSSIVCSTWALFFPSKNILRASYLSIALTIVTGIYLIMLHPTNLTQTCIMGILYVTAVSACTGFATYRFVRAKAP